MLTDPNAALRNLLAASPPPPPSPILRVGSVVRWRSTRTTGLGQVASINPDETVTIRTWLPARTVSVTVPLDRAQHLPHLTAAVEQADPTTTEGQQP